MAAFFAPGEPPDSARPDGLRRCVALHPILASMLIFPNLLAER